MSSNTVFGSIEEAEEFHTTKRDGAVSIRTECSNEVPVSVPTFMMQSVEKFKNHKAMAVFREGVWREWTYMQYLRDVKIISRAFLKLGLKRYHGVCILGFNSPEWFISELAAVFAGGLAAGIYLTNSPQACLACLIKAEADIVIVENQEQLEKILQVRDQVPHLRAIVQYTGKPSVTGVLSWEDLYDMGQDTGGYFLELETRLDNMVINKPCNLVYTSGTTGYPKGVLLSHDNITWEGRFGNAFDWREGKEVLISYMPLSHIAAKITDIYCSLKKGATVYFAKPDALKTSLKETMLEVRPTIFFGVPRVWEKIHESFQEAEKKLSSRKQKLLLWGQESSLLYHNNRGFKESLKYKISKKIVLEKVKFNIGLNRARYVVTTGAPTNPRVHQFFLSIDLPLQEVYGMSECAGPHTTSVKNYRSGSVGKVIPGCATKIDHPKGEICMKGRHVFMGYVDDIEGTNAAIDEDGYLHSGDCGTMNSNGFLSITGRIKEMIITSGGENIAPLLIETQVKLALPIISNCIVIGEQRKFLTMLFTLKTVPFSSEGCSQDQLDPIVIKWSEKLGVQATFISELLNPLNQKVKDAIQNGINEANSHAISRAQKIQKWAILPTDFSVEGGELGPTMKMNRSYITHKYADVIDLFYQDPKDDGPIKGNESQAK